MKSGQGRLILHDGTDLPIGYCLFRSQAAFGCRGVLIGNIRSINQNSFLKLIKIVPDDGNAFFAHVINHSERHVRFVANRGRLNFPPHSRFPRRRGRPLSIAQ